MISAGIFYHAPLSSFQSILYAIINVHALNQYISDNFLFTNIFYKLNGSFRHFTNTSM